MVTQNVAVRFSPEGGAEVRRELQMQEQAATQAYGAMGAAAERAGERSAAAAAEQMNAWRTQARQAREVVEREMAQASFNNALGVRGPMGAYDRAGREADLIAAFGGAPSAGFGGMSAHGRLNMLYQGQDIAIQLSGGQNPALVAMQQGSQVMGIMAAEGIKLDAALMRLIGTWGAAGLAVAGLTGAIVAEEVAWRKRQEALVEAADIGEELEDINRRLASASSAMIPALQAEAAQLRASAAAAREKAAADAVMYEQMARNPFADLGDPGGAGGDRARVRAQRSRETEAEAQRLAYSQNIGGLRDEWSERATVVRESLSSLASGFGRDGEELTADGRAALQRGLADIRRQAMAEIGSWELAAERAAGDKERSTIWSGGADILAGIISSTNPTPAARGGGRTAAVVDLAARRAALQLQNELNIAQAAGDRDRIEAAQRQLEAARAYDQAFAATNDRAEARRLTDGYLADLAAARMQSTVREREAVEQAHQLALARLRGDRDMVFAMEQQAEVARRLLEYDRAGLEVTRERRREIEDMVEAQMASGPIAPWDESAIRTSTPPISPAALGEAVAEGERQRAFSLARKFEAERTEIAASISGAIGPPIRAAFLGGAQSAAELLRYQLLNAFAEAAANFAGRRIGGWFQSGAMPQWLGDLVGDMINREAPKAMAKFDKFIAD